MRKSILLLSIFTMFVLGACGEASPAPETAPSDTPVPEPSDEPTDIPEPTASPTETLAPAEPIAIEADQLAADGCPIVELNPSSWQPLYAAYVSGGDPFFQIHTQEAPDTFYFNLELFTVYGPSWTGQLGTFTPDCNGNGLCVYLLPDAVSAYWATAGDMEIVSLAQIDGVFTPPLEIHFSNLTMEPVPGSGSPGCYNIDQVSITVEAN